MLVTLHHHNGNNSAQEMRSRSKKTPAVKHLDFDRLDSPTRNPKSHQTLFLRSQAKAKPSQASLMKLQRSKTGSNGSVPQQASNSLRLQMKIELSIYALNLKNVAGSFRGMSDPFCVVTSLLTKPGAKPAVLGKTEVIKSNPSPHWVKVFFL